MKDAEPTPTPTPKPATGTRETRAMAGAQPVSGDDKKLGCKIKRFIGDADAIAKLVSERLAKTAQLTLETAKLLVALKPFVSDTFMCTVAGRTGFWYRTESTGALMDYLCALRAENHYDHISNLLETYEEAPKSERSSCDQMNSVINIAEHIARRQGGVRNS